MEQDCWDEFLEQPEGYAENNYNLYKNADVFTGADPIPSDFIGTCWARWYLPADQPTGNYSVYTHIPRSSQNNFADNVLYRVIRAGSEIARVPVSQYEINNQVLNPSPYSDDPTVDAGWVYIGSYFFLQSDNPENYIE
ncbi:MAG: hypothetical protein GWN62_01590, partial [Aliifodinibius sp.]|nr:hypothetical protein [Fodinibius sp.]